MFGANPAQNYYAGLPQDRYIQSPNFTSMDGAFDRPGFQRMGWLANSGYDGPSVGSQAWQDARAQGQHPVMDWWRQEHPNWQAPQGFGGFTQPQMPQFNQPASWGNQGIAVGEYNPSTYGPRAGMGSNAWQGKPMQPSGLSSLFALPTKKQTNPGFY